MTAIREVARIKGPAVCGSGKYRYSAESTALEGLVRVRRDRETNGDEKPPESRIYFCDRCMGWHLTSREVDADVLNTEREIANGETWEVYARRLEKRIAAQRAEILSLHALGAGLSNRATRKRLSGLVIALGRMTENFERERRDRIALVEILKRDRCLWCRLKGHRA